MRWRTPRDVGGRDALWMDRALRLAARGIGLTSPNPMVGAVLVRDGRVVGEGAHLRAGGPHAEAVALAAAGPAARGATCYVTLEPCSHFGRTPPCADALVRDGVARVVTAMRDPSPEVDGRGLARLRAAGVPVSVGVREAQARGLNRAFVCAVTQGRPHVTLKAAMTLDGKIAAADGASRWITGDLARLEAHRLRFAADAVLVGVGTVLADDPQLTVRHAGLPPKEPLRVVVDSRLRTPAAARVLRSGDPRRAVVACVAPAPAGPAAVLRAQGNRVIELPSDGGRVDLRLLLEALRALDVIAVLAEGGAEIGGALAEAGLVDRVAFFVAPRLLGGREAPGPLGGRGRPLKEALSLTDVVTRRLGEDLLVEAEVGR
ncbi:MAG TPA: bifunctional diaminohydroxyphosphoribosylaminopyrimidine deaminase/5-amino-6-(5-phosphoribosylamino)uracil reductase RibD [Methylomirabilota bacterium]|jgi:diaminohydroxyphosphoribosylaminopyrimidine deaminase/5-amino-6-(5-phosphoribosylamino)uracil reductase|nr:bifunctional diaminohydroxyphosphoribosylaminopyrimidine deaminase/5-amino-6-(5-phosphoribosylamino)uracil reductase RibD [Methylomirabilota bacterium]